jgi:hypothetical protein
MQLYAVSIKEAIFSYWTPSAFATICRQDVGERLMASTIEELRAENIHLRDLVISLSAMLLRDFALNLPKSDHRATAADVEHLMQEADKCFHCARTPGLRPEVAEGLEVAGNELMARAVDIETRLQREKRDK